MAINYWIYRLDSKKMAKYVNNNLNIDITKHILDVLIQDINELNEQVNWSEKYYIKLEAEVEIHKNRNKKNEKDLIKAINNSDDNLFCNLYKHAYCLMQNL
jgi:hypothetical protein